jgi:peptide/nickel transport system ATP-binding protein
LIVTLLSVNNLTTEYHSARGPIRAVDGVCFTLERGQSLGISGESGCGKSTVAFSLMRLIKGGRVVAGTVHLNGRSLLDLPIKEFNRLRWKEMSLVAQAAMGALNPVYRIGDQIVEAIQAHTASNRKAAWMKAEELLRQVDMDPARCHNYPHELSGGMRQRAMIAMALALQPSLVIADEPTTALDMVTQAQIIKLMNRLRRQLNLAVIIISHDPSILGQACDRLAVMYAGRLIELGDTAEVLGHPRHPYTRALLDSFPNIESGRKELKGLSGSPPDLVAPPSGCRLHERCPQALSRCRAAEPELAEVASGHMAACFLKGA